MRERGFTLMEIMIVVAIIGMLAALVGPEIIRDLERAEERVALTQCKIYFDAVWKWRIYNKTREVPESLEEIEDEMLRIENDPWGSPYRIVSPDRKRFRIWSNGPDAVEGTGDDICYVPLKK